MAFDPGERLVWPLAISRVEQAMDNNITPGTWALVRLHPDCPGDGRRPHHPAEDGCRVEVTVADHHKNGDHHVFGLYKGGGRNVPGPPGGPGIGRFRPDELEPIDPPW